MDKDKKETLAEVFPPNRKNEKDEPKNKQLPEKKKVEKVVTGKVKKQKRGLGKKVSDVLLEDDTKSVGSYIFYDVLIPAAKAMISDMVGGGLDMLLFGEKRPRGGSIRRDGGRSYTDYGAAYGRSIYGRNNAPATRAKKEQSRTARARHDFDEIIFETRGEAEDVLAHLSDLTLDFQRACVSDLYELAGIDSNFTDEKYGWIELGNAYISRVRGGYLINLPRPVLLD